MQGGLDPSVIEQIRDASEIGDVVGGYIPLKRVGANLRALCPFHTEKTPSFYVNTQRQTFHCFGCHKGGDVFTFIREYENVSFLEAARRLAERARIAIPRSKARSSSGEPDIRDTLLRIHEDIAVYWHDILKNDGRAHEARLYLEKRALDHGAIRTFRIGYAPEPWDDIRQWAKSHGLHLPQMERAGLVGRQSEGKGYYGRFRGRIMFPITDLQGRVIGFSGRIIRPQPGTGKYVNSPETPIFKKGKVLFGLHQARGAILDAGNVILCEGQLDLIRCHVNGIANVVAPQGTALTADHARIIRNYAREVILCYDSDNAGHEAVPRSFDALFNAGLTIRVAEIPPPHDPDSLILEQGAEAFRERVEQARSYFDYLLDDLCRRHAATGPQATDSGRIAVIETMAETLHKTKNAVLTDTYAQKTGRRLGVSSQAVWSEFERRQRRQWPRVRGEPAEAAPDRAIPKPTSLEAWLLRLVFSQETQDMQGWLFSHLDFEWIRHVTVKQAILACFDLHRNARPLHPGEVVSQLESTEAQAVMTEILTEGRALPNPTRQLADVVQRLRNQHLDREMDRLRQGLSNPAIGDAAVMECNRALQDLRQRKRQPLVPLADA